MTREDCNLLPLVLGTVQLGMNYGIANAGGRPDREKALDIIQTAWEGGIRFFDTAQAYGESEEVLGRCFRRMAAQGIKHAPRVISKLRPDVDPLDHDGFSRAIDESLGRLGVDRLWGFMLHRESELDKPQEALAEMVMAFKGERRFEYFGVSVYSAGKAIEALKRPEIDMVQLPFNIFDQRALREGVLDLAKEKGKHIFLRSVYLQGLLTMEPGTVPEGMSFARKDLEIFREMLKGRDISPKLGALAFALKNAPEAFLVLGAETPEQVAENIRLFEKAVNTALPDLRSLASNDPQLINPALWKH